MLFLYTPVCSTRIGPSTRSAFTTHIEKEERRPLIDRCMEAIEVVMTQCMGVSACVLIHTLAGGTGSGLSCAVAERMRAAHPKIFLLDVSICPHRTGETPLQSHNTVLCLAKQHIACDSILLLENDVALSALQEHVNDNVSMADINEYFATSLAALFVPMQGKPVKTPKPYARSDIWDVIANVSPLPACKIIQLRSIASHRDPAVLGIDLYAKLHKALPHRQSSGEASRVRAVVINSMRSLQVVFLSSQVVFRGFTDRVSVHDSSAIITKALTVSGIFLMFTDDPIASASIRPVEPLPSRCKDRSVCLNSQHCPSADIWQTRRREKDRHQRSPSPTIIPCTVCYAMGCI